MDQNWYRRLFAVKNGTLVFGIYKFDIETFKREQREFVNLLAGMFGMIRKPLADNPKVE